MNFKCLCAVLVVAAAPLFAQPVNRNLPVCTLAIENADNMKVNVKVELAKTAKEQTYGLMNRDSLGENAGMLFIFENDSYRNFWMKNTRISLSIAYIGSDGIIKEIYDMKPLDTTITYPSRHPVRYALEVNRGWFKKNGISTGCKVLLDSCR